MSLGSNSTFTQNGLVLCTIVLDAGQSNHFFSITHSHQMLHVDHPITNIDAASARRYMPTSNNSAPLICYLGRWFSELWLRPVASGCHLQTCWMKGSFPAVQTMKRISQPKSTEYCQRSPVTLTVSPVF